MIWIWTFQPGYLKNRIIEAQEFWKGNYMTYRNFPIVIFEYNILSQLFVNIILPSYNHRIAKTIHHAIVMVTIGKVNKLIFMGLWLFEWLNFSFSSTIIIRVLNLVALSHNQNMLLINRQLISAAASSFSSSRGNNIQRIFLETKRR